MCSINNHTGTRPPSPPPVFFDFYSKNYLSVLANSSEKSFGKSTSSYNIKGIGSPHNPPTAGSRRFLARVERLQAGKTGLRV